MNDSPAEINTSGDGSKDEYMERLKINPKFFEKEKKKWLRTKSKHEFYPEIIPLRDEWEICFVPLGVGAFWVMAANALSNPLANMIGVIDLLYGSFCLAATPFMPTEKEYNERTKELERIGMERGFYGVGE
jgi:hypothetical protein